MSPPAAARPVEAQEEDTPEKRKLRIERLKAMIQQASSKEGDGQQAAWKACAIIRKFGLDIVDPVLVDSLHEENHRLRVQLEAAKQGADLTDPDVDQWGASSSGNFGSVSMNQPVGGGFGGAQPPNSSFFSSFSGGFGGAGKTKTKPAATQPTQPPVAAQQPAMGAPRLLQSSAFAGKCKQCGKVINKGDPVKWQKSVGVWCPTTSCYNDWLTNQSSAANFNPFTP